MYNIKNETKYYIYNCRDERYISVHNSIEDLLTSISYIYNYANFTGKGNYLLEEYNCTGKDTINYFRVEGRIARKYIVFDSSFRIIDMRIYKDKILKSNAIPKFRRFTSSKNKPEFRKGAVPFTGRYHKRSHECRHPHTFQEIRNNTNPEYKEYIRGRRKHLPTVWDDLYNKPSYSWKNQSKKRKQWM